MKRPFKPTLYPPLSWTEAVELAASRTRRDAKVYGGDSSQDRGDDESWCIGGTFADCMKIAREGWTEGATALAAAELPRAEGDPDADWHLAPAGFFPEVGAYVAGEPDCMYRLDVNPDARRRVRLFVPTAYSWFITADFMKRYAYALAAYVRGLEACGYAVSIVVVDLCNGTDPDTAHHDWHARAYEVKRADEPMMLSRVAFAAHPAFFRRVVFAVRELTEGAGPRVGARGYGKGYNRVTPEHRAAAAAMIDAEQLDQSDIRICLPSPMVMYAADSSQTMSADKILNDYFRKAPLIDGAVPTTGDQS